MPSRLPTTFQLALAYLMVPGKTGLPTSSAHTRITDCPILDITYTVTVDQKCIP